MASPTRGEGPFPGSAYPLFAELLPRIFENAVDGICLTSTSGAIHAANPAACRIFGRSEEEIRRLGRDGLLDRADPRLASALGERSRTGRSHAELTVVRPDGTVVPVEVTSAVLTEPGPDSPAVIFLRDISDRVRDRDALARERALLDRILSSLEDGILVLDARTRTFVHVNPAAERLLGWTAAELAGRDTTILYGTREEFEDVGRRYRPALAEKGFFSDELELRRKDGGAVPVRRFMRPVADAEGVLSIVVTVFRDLTDERRAEAERARLQAVLLQAQKLEGLGVLTAGLAHDFNNLLVPILGNATLVAASLPADEPLRGPIEDVAVAARQAAELVAQLLAYTGRPPGTLAPLDVAREAIGSTELLRACLPKKAALQLELPSTPLPILGDAAQLKQLLVSLATNAGEALAECGGAVTVRAGVETCAADHRALSLAEPPLPPGRYAWIEVADDGPGMPPEVASRATDPFFTTRGLGRGLGLAAVSGIVRAHHGALELETAPGAGTRVRAWIPAAAELPPPARAPGTAPAGSRILVVDDEPLVRHAARRILERAGYRVTEAGDGLDAVEQVRARPGDFDVVLLDLSMPKMSGEETFAALRALRKDLPVVLCSGYSASDVSERLLREPRVRFAAKPYDKQQLLAALRASSAPAGDPGEP